MSTDRQALLRDLAAAEFRIGERRGKWAFKGMAFPYALFFVAAPLRPRGPVGFMMRSECKGYSGVAPTSQLWHGGRNEALEAAHRPQTKQGLMTAFSTWGPCLYHPIDRLARDHWGSNYADRKWTPDKTISFLLETVYGLLHCSDYTHADLPADALKVPEAFVDERSR